MPNQFRHSISLNDKTFTRTSPRTYTHVVIGRKDVAKVRREAEVISATDRRNAAYYADCVTGKQSQASWKDSQYGTVQKRYVADGWTADVEANLKRIIEQRLRSMATWCGNGELQVLQWSMSEKNALAGMRTIANRGYHLDLAVVPVLSRTPAAKRQNSRQAQAEGMLRIAELGNTQP